MPNLDRRAGPLRPISYTASELVAEKILTRLYRLPPKGMSWRQFAITESPPRFAPATPAGLFLLARHASCLTTLPGWSPAGCRLGVEPGPITSPGRGSSALVNAAINGWRAMAVEELHSLGGNRDPSSGATTLAKAISELRKVLSSEPPLELTTEYLIQLQNALGAAERAVRAERWAREGCEFKGE
jgi:hypothetical protein